MLLDTFKARAASLRLMNFHVFIRSLETIRRYGCGRREQSSGDEAREARTSGSHGVRRQGVIGATVDGRGFCYVSRSACSNFNVRQRRAMNTPEWFGSIGVMNSAHMHRRGVIARLRLVLGEIGAAAGRLRGPRVQGPSLLRSCRAASRRNRSSLAEDARPAVCGVLSKSAE